MINYLIKKHRLKLEKLFLRLKKVPIKKDEDEGGSIPGTISFDIKKRQYFVSNKARKWVPATEPNILCVIEQYYILFEGFKKPNPEEGLLIKRTNPCVICGKDNYLEEVLSGNYFTIVNHEKNQDHEYICFKCFIKKHIREMVDGGGIDIEVLNSIGLLKRRNIKLDHIVYFYRMKEDYSELEDLLNVDIGHE
jgi:hypothetical protein